MFFFLPCKFNIALLDKNKLETTFFSLSLSFKVLFYRKDAESIFQHPEKSTKRERERTEALSRKKRKRELKRKKLSAAKKKKPDSETERKKATPSL